MISKKMQDALNGQINAEMYSSYLYLSMAAWFESVNLGGMAKWMQAQAGEEHGHAMKLFHHIVERGGKVTLTAIDAPKTKWASPLAVFEDAYAHEQKVTKLIHALADQAATAKDHAAAVMLQWFISEQVEEEASASKIVEQLKMVGDATGPLLMLDHALGQRGS